MSESIENWREPLEPQTIPIKRKRHAHEELPGRSLRIKETKFLGSGSSGVVRAVEAELVRRPRFLSDPIGWFSPQSRELKNFAIKVIRQDRVGEAMESYARCKDAGLTVPTTYRHVELRDGRSAILMADLRKDGFAVAQSEGMQADLAKPKARMEIIENLDDLLKAVFDDALLASREKNYGILLGGDSIFFLMPQAGGVGKVKHIFADFDRMYQQENRNSTTLAALSGKAQEYKKEVTKINIGEVKNAFEKFIKGFVGEKLQKDHLARLESYVQDLNRSV